MRVIKKKTLRAYWEKHSDARPGLENWLSVAEASRWQSHDDVVRSAPGRPSPIDGDRIVFDIGGGRFRLVAAFYYPAGTIFVKWFGTHSEYDSVDVAAAENF